MPPTSEDKDLPHFSDVPPREAAKVEVAAQKRRAMLGSSLANASAAIRALRPIAAAKPLADKLETQLVNLGKAADITGDDKPGMLAFNLVDQAQATAKEAVKAVQPGVKFEDLGPSVKLAEKILSRHGIGAAGTVARFLRAGAREVLLLAKTTADAANKSTMSKAAKTLRMAAHQAYRVAATTLPVPKRAPKGDAKAKRPRTQRPIPPSKSASVPASPASTPAKSAGVGAAVLALGVGTLYVLSRRR